MTTTTLTEQQTADLEQLAMHRAKIAEEIKQLDELRKEYDEKITALAGEGTTKAGPYKVTVTRPRRLDAKALEDAYPVIDRPELYKRAIDTAAVKKHFSPADLEQFQTVGTPTVRIS